MAVADAAETFPDSGVLNWGEIGWRTLTAFVQLSMEIGGDSTLPDCDVESVKGVFERWWKAGGSRLRRGVHSSEMGGWCKCPSLFTSIGIRS
jgi:hypothetical protein